MNASVGSINAFSRRSEKDFSSNSKGTHKPSVLKHTHRKEVVSDRTPVNEHWIKGGIKKLSMMSQRKLNFSVKSLQKKFFLVVPMRRRALCRLF